MTIGDTFRHLGSHAADDPRPDAELVGRFVRSRDEPAFAELLRRHGPAVYGVCRRILGNTHDADDAFQAVFLVLARKADTVRPPGMVGPWLYGVAVRTANKARVMNAKKASREQRAATARERAAETPLPGGRGSQETLDVIDAELATLPAAYRAVFVACEVHGRSRSQAARDLGWPEGTVAARLAKARELLAARLTKRGVTLTAGLFATAGVPAALASDTLGAVRELLAAGTVSVVTPAAQTLSDEVVKSMSGVKQKLLAVGMLAAGLVAGTALLAGPGEKPGPRPVPRAVTNAPVPKPLADEWKEGKPIEFADGGRVTSVAYSPSGEVLAVCRDSGAINFYKGKTRERLTEMAVKHDPKVNPNTEVRTFPALAFRPRPHAKLGEVFAVTHKNGVNFGTTNIGLLVDNAPAVNDLPQNWAEKDSDPHQLTWLSDQSLAATNGETTWFPRFDSQVAPILTGWKQYRHKPTVLAAIPGREALLFRFDNDLNQPDPSDRFDLWHAEPMAKVGDSEKWRRISGHKSRPLAGAVSADGKRIVTGDEGGTLIVWEGEKFEENRRIEFYGALPQLALAPDGTTLAVVRMVPVALDVPDGEFTLFDLYLFPVTTTKAPPKPVWSVRLRGRSSGPVSLAFSPDGNTLLAAFADPYPADKDAKSGGVKVWERVPKK